MGLRLVLCLGLLVILLFYCHGRAADQGGHGDAPRQLSVAAKLAAAHDMPELDVTTPLATVPVVNPTAPTVTTPTAMPASATPSLANPVAAGGGGGSWCVASQGASTPALQVALDYACGHGADCSAIKSGGSCFNPDTVRDHASYAFNSYYQKNPVQTSCDFGGTAILTTTNPSTSTCQYPATSTGASVLNTSTPAAPAFGSPVYENSPPGGYGSSPPLYGSLSPPGYGDSIGAAGSKRAAALSLSCLLAATMSLSLCR